MSTIRICESWDMKFEAPLPGEQEEWFLDWVLRSPKNASKHITASWHTMKAISDCLRDEDSLNVESVREYFGGMGAHALLAQHFFAPDYHMVLEYSEDAVEHLRWFLPASVGAKHADSYNPIQTQEADVVLLDFGDLTVWKTREGEKHRDLLDRVFMLEPKAVMITDIACRYLHLHRERYETILGEGSCVDYLTYLDALYRRIEDLYGYTFVVSHWDRWSAVAGFVREDFVKPGYRGDIRETPAAPVGIEIL